MNYRPVAVPDDDDVTGGIGGNGRISLIARHVGVDTELRAERRTGACVAAAEDVPRGDGLERLAMPYHDEVAGGVAATTGHSCLSVV